MKFLEIDIHFYKIFRKAIVFIKHKAIIGRQRSEIMQQSQNCCEHKVVIACIKLGQIVKVIKFNV